MTSLCDTNLRTRACQLEQHVRLEFQPSPSLFIGTEWLKN
jgi:hypothetical protein